MTDTDKIAMLKTLTDETDESVLSAYLSMAAAKIIHRMYPFGTTSSMKLMPSKYEMTQINIAVYLLDKRGAEGETQHIENGTTHTYEDGDIPSSLLSEVTPFVAPLE